MSYSELAVLQTMDACQAGNLMNKNQASVLSLNLTKKMKTILSYGNHLMLTNQDGNLLGGMVGQVGI